MTALGDTSRPAAPTRERFPDTSRAEGGRWIVLIEGGYGYASIVKTIARRRSFMPWCHGRVVGGWGYGLVAGNRHVAARQQRRILRAASPPPPSRRGIQGATPADGDGRAHAEDFCARNGHAFAPWNCRATIAKFYQLISAATIGTFVSQ